jgi:O-antigen/teichoic acid export membrane protein
VWACRTLQTESGIRPAEEGSHDHDAKSRETGPGMIRGRGLIGSAALVFGGNLVARFLGLLFVVAAARYLLPANYGLLAYTLVIVSFGTILITNAPAGLSGFLVRSADQRIQQDRYYSNWLAVVTGMLAVSLVGIVPVALIAGLRGWMIAAVMANLLGIAIFSTYREAQRGLGNFRSMSVFYILANLAQLIGIIVAALLGHRDAALFVAIYGLSNLAALLVIQILAPMPLSFVLSSVRMMLARRIAIFSWPVVVQTALFAIWFGSDIILVRRFLAPSLTGDYAAAKTLVNVVALPASAIGTSLVAGIAGLSGPHFRRYLTRTLSLTAAVVAPSLAVLVIYGNQIAGLVFSAKYPQAATPLPWLAVGMAAYGFYLIFESVWVGMGRPLIDAIATGAGMVVTLAAGLILVPTTGLAGAAGAFAFGAVVQVLVIATFTMWAYTQSRRADRPLARFALLDVETNVGSAAG